MTAQDWFAIQLLGSFFSGGCIGYGIVGLYLAWKERR